MSILRSRKTQKSFALAKALFRVSDELGLEATELAETLGLEIAEISRAKKNMFISPNSQEGETALQLIRLARILYILTNGDKDWIQSFMRSKNGGTGGIPAKQITTQDGLMKVHCYLDAITQNKL